MTDVSFYGTESNMERTNVKFKKPKVNSYWRGAHNISAGDVIHNEYMTKLMSLRDSLADKEQVCLDQALNRLGVQSQLNKPSSYRLRMDGNDITKPSSQPQGLNMLSTVEKFRQIRQRQQNQQLMSVIPPLEGKQIFNRKRRTYCDQPVYHTESSTDRDEKGNDIRVLALSNIEEIIQNDQLRSMQITNRFLLTDKKTRMNQEWTGSKMIQASSLQSGIYYQPGMQLARSFLPTDNFCSITSSLYDNPLPTKNRDNVRRHHGPSVANFVNQSPNKETQTVTSSAQPADMDTLKKFHYDSYIDCNRSSNNENCEKLFKKEVCNGGKSRCCSSPLPLPSNIGLNIPSNIGHNIPSNIGHNIPSNIGHNILPVSSKKIKLNKNKRPDKKITNTEIYRNGCTVILINNDDRNIKVNTTEYNSRNHRPVAEQSQRKPLINGDLYNTGDESDDENMDLIVTRLPTIRQHQNFKHASYRDPKESIKLPKLLKDSNCDSKTHSKFTDHVKNLPREQSQTTGSEFLGYVHQRLETRSSRRHKIKIVIEMPNIAMSSPSPDLDSSVDDLADPKQEVNQVQSNISQPS